MTKRPEEMGMEELCGWFRLQLKRLRQQLIVIGDFGEDLDDEDTLLLQDGERRSRELAFLNTHGSRRQDLFDLKAVIANLAPPTERARLAKGTLQMLGQPNVPVGVGTDCGNTVGEKLKKLQGIPYMAGADEVEDGVTLLARALEEADDQSITLILISGLTDIAAQLRTNSDLVKRKVRTVAIMGGVTIVKETGAVFVNADGYMEAEADAANNKFDLEAAKYVYQRFQELGIPLVILTRHAAGACQVPRQFYDDLAATGHPVGVKLRQSQQGSIEALWKRANLPADHHDREKLPNRCDKAWFCTTFCGGNGMDRDGSDSIWDLIKGFNLYDPMTLIASVPELREKFFEPVVVKVGDVEHLIIGPVKAQPCVKDPQGLADYMVQRCLSSLQISLEEVVIGCTPTKTLECGQAEGPPTPPPNAVNAPANAG